MRWIALMIGIAAASVALAILAFAPVPVPPPPPGFVVECGAPTPPPGFEVVCYDRVAPAVEDVIRFGLILTIDIAAVMGLGWVIGDAMPPPEDRSIAPA